MSRKNRRQRKPNLPPEAFNVPTVAPRTPTGDADVDAPKPVAAAHRSQPSIADLRAEYRNVLTDLRTTLSIFASLIAVMVVLSFVLR